MRKDDVRRYCIPCSLESGRLTQRVAPSLSRQRAARDSARRQKVSKRAARAASRETDRWNFDGVDMRAEFKRLLALPVFRPVRASLAKLELSVHRGRRRDSTGHHKLHQGIVHVTIGTGAWFLGSAVLLHEICHGAHALLGLTRAHRRRFRLPGGHSGVALRHTHHDAAFHDLLRVAACQAFDLDGLRLMALHREAGGTRRAYAMDAALRQALSDRFGSPAAEATPSDRIPAGS